MKKVIAVLAAPIAFLTLTSSALANHVTDEVVSCSGLTANYDAFPTGPASITEFWSTGQTIIAPTSGPSGSITTPLPVIPPNGTVVTVSGHRTGSTDAQFSVTSTLSCQPPPPPPPPPPPSPPPPPPAVVVPPPLPPSAPPVAVLPPPHHPRAPAPCVKVKARRFHARIGPQRILRGNATLRASGPKTVTRVTVTVYGAGGHVWSKTGSGSSLTLRLSVTNRRFWGVDHRCGCTYGPHDRVRIAFRYRCGVRVLWLRYDNEDGPRWLRLARRASL